MSWDIFVRDIPREATSVQDIPDSFAPRSVGKRSTIIDGIRSAVPGADFTDPSWGTIDGPGYSIEVNLGTMEELQGFAFHIRGGDQAAFVVADILDRLGLRAFDPGSDTGIFSVGLDGSDGQKKWRAYRDSIILRKQ